MDTFDFCPKGCVPETLPREPQQVVSMNGWTFSSKPTVPFVKKIKLTLHGLQWQLNTATGVYDNATNPTTNAKRLEEFYQAHETWDPFYWTHPHTGVQGTYRFAAAVQVPAGSPNSNGLVPALEVTLIEHDPGYS